jgi:hypothetical protein
MYGGQKYWNPVLQLELELNDAAVDALTGHRIGLIPLTRFVFESLFLHQAWTPLGEQTPCPFNGGASAHQLGMAPAPTSALPLRRMVAARRPTNIHRCTVLPFKGQVRLWVAARTFP